MMNIIKRYYIYFKKMFPLQRYGVLCSLMFFSYYFLIQFIDSRAIQIQPGAFFGWGTIILNFLLMRLFDELKDQHIDGELFPDRPLVLGQVKYSDVKILALCAMFGVLLLNFNRGIVTSIYLVYFVLLILSWQWWLFPEKVSSSFILTSLTHQPLIPLSYLYIYAVYLNTSGSPRTNWLLAVGIAFIFSFPFLAWEIARKIKTKEEETAYLTYSKRWGTTKAAILPLVYTTLTTLGMVLIALVFKLSFIFLFYLIGLQLVCGFFILRFIFKPTPKRNIIKSIAELYSLAFQGGVLVELFLKNVGW